MSIDIELTLVLGLFIVGAVVLAVDNQVDALHRRLIRSFRRKKSVPADKQSLHPTKNKNYNRLRQPVVDHWEKMQRMIVNNLLLIHLGGILG